MCAARSPSPPGSLAGNATTAQQSLLRKTLAWQHECLGIKNIVKQTLLNCLQSITRNG